MNQEKVNSLFKEMKQTIASKTEFHRKSNEIYDGDYNAPTLDISLAPDYDKKLKTRLDWARIAVNILLAELQLDAFKNDTFGFTQLIERSGMYPAFNSAIKNSEIGAVSFLTILPRDIEGAEFPTATVYTGAEATALYDSRSRKLKAGLVINKRKQNGTAADYLMFLPGLILKLNDTGQIVKVVKLPINEVMMVEFVYNRDTGRRPFGESRINPGCISALESGLRTSKLAEIAEDLRIGGGVFVIASGTPDDNKMRSSTSGKIGRITTVFAEDGPNSVKLDALKLPSAEKLNEQMTLHANNFAAAAFISPTSLGYHPSNGSFSEGTLLQQNKPYAFILDALRESYGDSIKRVAILTMGILTGKIEEDWNQITPVFMNSRNESLMGSVGDGSYKLKEIGFDPETIKEYARQALGISLKTSALAIPMPNFELAREVAAEYKALENDLIEPDGSVSTAFAAPKVIV